MKSSQAKSSSTKTTTNEAQPDARQNSDSLPNEDSTSSCSRTNSKYCKSITATNPNDDQTNEPNQAVDAQAGQRQLANCTTYQDTNNNALVQSTTDLSSSSPATTIIELHSSTNTPMHLLDSAGGQQNGQLNGGLQKGGTTGAPAMTGQQMTELLPMKQLSAGKAYSVVVAGNDKTTTTLILSEESSAQFNVDEQLVVTCNGGGSEMSAAEDSKNSIKKNKPNKQTNQSNISKEMAARLKQKQQQDSKRERKTARILAIITGVFVVRIRKRN